MFFFILLSIKKVNNITSCFWIGFLINIKTNKNNTILDFFFPHMSYISAIYNVTLWFWWTCSPQCLQMDWLQQTKQITHFSMWTHASSFCLPWLITECLRSSRLETHDVNFQIWNLLNSDKRVLAVFVKHLASLTCLITL